MGVLEAQRGSRAAARPARRPRVLSATLLGLALFSSALGLAWSGREAGTDANGPDAARAGYGEPEGKEETMPGERTEPRYSRSGYDITPWSEARRAEARTRLTAEQERIAFHAATEAPFCGLYTETAEPGVYVSVVSGLPLFRSQAKFHSQSGWASFVEPFDPDHVVAREDRSHGMVRTEILDARSGAHLGHVFDDGPPPTGKRYCLNSAALRFIPEGEPLPPESRPVEARRAYFAGGCFWGIEDRFARLPGVLDAVSGYMGGHVPDPSYRQVCGGGTGHAETVEVTYDPARVRYEDLLRAFFGMHDPTTVDRQGPDVGSQYRSAIFAVDEDQARAARETIAALQAAPAYAHRRIVTAVAPAGPFHRAEEYHQDYHARHGTSCGI